MRRAGLVLWIAFAAAMIAVAGTRSPEATAEGAAEPTAGARLSTLLGIVDGKLSRIDPKTLEPVAGRSLSIGAGGCTASQGGTACWNVPAWAASPDGTRVAVANAVPRTLRVVDVSSLRVAAELRLGLDGGSIGSLTWLGRQTVVGIQQTFGEKQRAVAFDLGLRRMVAQRPLPGRVTELERTARALVLLLAPADTIGPARLAVVDARGRLRAVRLDRIAAGSKVLGGSTHRVDSRSPGLAVDPRGRRAVVVAQSLLAEVDLRTLAVSYHQLERPRSLLGRLWRWLEPVASAKQVSGYHRQAAWLGNGVIALAGTDTSDGRYEPSGLQLVDASAWNATTLDRGAMAFQATADALLATGGRWDASARRNTGIGLAAYGLDGGRRFQLFDDEHVWVALVHGGRAWIGGTGAASSEPLRIVDLATGRVVGTRERPLPWLLVGPAGGGFSG